MQKMETADSFHSKILFSDEEMFHLDGNVSKHNLHYYSIENPHMCYPKSVKSRGLTVWTMIGYNGLCPLDISRETMDGDRYLFILKEKVYPYLCHRKQMLFQQDGAPGHFKFNVREFLNAKLPQRWIGRRGSLCEFPPRSPTGFDSLRLLALGAFKEENLFQKASLQVWIS
jgi:hypothetical protein